MSTSQLLYFFFLSHFFVLLNFRLSVARLASAHLSDVIIILFFLQKRTFCCVLLRVHSKCRAPFVSYSEQREEVAQGNPWLGPLSSTSQKTHLNTHTYTHTHTRAHTDIRSLINTPDYLTAPLILVQQDVALLLLALNPSVTQLHLQEHSPKGSSGFSRWDGWLSLTCNWRATQTYTRILTITKKLRVFFFIVLTTLTSISNFSSFFFFF